MYKGIPLSLIPTCQWQVGTAKPTHKSEQVLPTIRYHKYPVANRQHQPASNGSRGNEHGCSGRQLVSTDVGEAAKLLKIGRFCAYETARNRQLPFIPFPYPIGPRLMYRSRLNYGTTKASFRRYGALSSKSMYFSEKIALDATRD